jgi:prephenate dehydrogenase
MPTYRKVAIVGVGLIGGSVGLALRQRGLAEKVVGVGRRQSSLDRALACQAMDESDTDLENGVDGAELVVVATPVAEIADLVCRVVETTGKDVLVTDVGSTKATICAEIESRLAAAAGQFVGSHPLAGDHRTGPENARGDLFVGKTVVVTPTASTSGEALSQVEALWQNLGGLVTKLSPAEHDEALAATSHLPHLVASALAAATPAPWLHLAATGWADTTRVAAGDPELWGQIFAQNRAAMLAALHRFDELLQLLQTHLTEENWPELQQLLQQAKRTRDALGN